MKICDHASDILTTLATELEAACPEHGTGDEAWASCHCEIVAELRVKAQLAATEREARATTLPKTWRGTARQIGVSDSEYLERLERGEKWCGGCRSWHPRSKFGSDRSRGDGLQPRCKESLRRPRPAKTALQRQAQPQSAMSNKEGRR
ncbi:hypothetical protein [Streptomyces omiyaensis]|uniref:hypothetical protein n=1 Tax=Streptomyces omiyaensis TaxID=68247 RepID=UPI0036F79741